jgi:hypothetical protein
VETSGGLSLNMHHGEFFPLFFPIYFVILWLVVTSVIGFTSGWYGLQKKYPDKVESPLLKLNYQSAMMGCLTRMRRILRFEVCPSGLRIGMMKVFGIFCRNFFVPWEEIRIERKDRFFWQEAQLKFGNPAVGKLSIAPYIANRLARASQGHWPEPGPFPVETSKQAFSNVLKQWAYMTAIAAIFFIVVPRIVFPTGVPWPPISVAILFPAIVFGIGSIFIYFNRIKK